MSALLSDLKIGIAGYWLANPDGRVTAFGYAPFHGSPVSVDGAAPIVAMAALPDGSGYWLTGRDGGVFAFGEAAFHGSLPALGVDGDIVGMAALADGSGYWLAGSDGGVFAFGNAEFHGSLPMVGREATVVGMSALPDGSGYWLVGEDGDVFAFANAGFHGSLPSLGVAARVIGMNALPDGSGYWLIGADGGVFALGAAPFHGSLPGLGHPRETIAMVATGPDGYLIVTREGGVHPFGVAAFHGSLAHEGNAGIAAAAVLAPDGPVLGTAAADLLGHLQVKALDEERLGYGRQSAIKDIPVGGIAFPATEHPRASIVVPVYGEATLTVRCLASVAAAGSSVPYEVIVVDDCSPDDTMAVLKRVTNVKVVRNSSNRGFTRACNAGYAAASGEYVVLLNNDTEVTAGWLEELVTTADADPDVALVGSKLIFADGTLQEAGGIIWSDGTGHNYGRGDDPGSPMYNYVRDVDYCSGASLLVRRSLLDELGGLDERYAPAYYEDTDVAFAARSLGRRVVYQPKSVVVHHEGGSHGTDLLSGVKRFQEVNRLVFTDKWDEPLAAQYPPGSSLLLARDARRGPRAVVVDHMVPLYDQDAGSVRMLALVSLLIELGFVVTFVPANWTALQPYTERLQQMGVEVLYGPVNFAAHIAAMGSELKLCILSRPNVASQFIGTVRAHAPAATVVYDTVDLHFLRERRCAEVSGSASLHRVSEATREIELGMVRAADMTFAVTPEERKVILDEVPGATVHIIPTIHEQRGATVGPEDRNGLLFIGSFLHEPNRDAVKHLVADVMPLLRRLLPGVHLVIAGSSPTPDVLALSATDVDVLGWVPDLTALYEKARVFVAPLRFGAGMKGKIGDALARGLPAVVTSMGAEGMGLVHEREILIADGPVPFAEEVVRLHEDDVLWGMLAEQGRAAITERYAPAKVKEQLRHLLTEAGVLVE